MLTRCLKDATNAKKSITYFLRGINQFPHDYQMNIAHSASRVTLSCWGMEEKFLTVLKCCILHLCAR